MKNKFNGCKMKRHQSDGKLEKVSLFLDKSIEFRKSVHKWGTWKSVAGSNPKVFECRDSVKTETPWWTPAMNLPFGMEK